MLRPHPNPSPKEALEPPPLSDSSYSAANARLTDFAPGSTPSTATMPKPLSHRSLVLLLVVYTASMAALMLILALMIAGYGDTGTGDALSIAAPFVLLLCALGLATYLVAMRMLRQGREKRALACMCGYACLPWPMMAALLY